MADKSTQDPNTGNTEEYKEQATKYNLSKFEYDLFHDEDDKAEKVIRVRRFALPNKGERWKIFEDNKIVWILEGSKLTKKERDFFKTPDGINWILSEHKKGIKSFNSFKQSLKKRMSEE